MKRLTPEDGLPFGFAKLKEEGVESGGVEDGHDDHISPHDLHRRRTRWRRNSGGNWNGSADTKKDELDKLYAIKSPSAHAVSMQVTDRRAVSLMGPQIPRD